MHSFEAWFGEKSIDKANSALESLFHIQTLSQKIMLSISMWLLINYSDKEMVSSQSAGGLKTNVLLIHIFHVFCFENW